jgi:tetraacyldisaccharide 4'-kinase
VREGGDEPLLLAESLKGVASIVCDRDRTAAALWAREGLGAQIFVLDDGFQHMRIARDLDIVTLDATEPWGGGHMLPRGRLREPVSGLARADCVVITRAELAGDLGGLRAEVLRVSGGRAAVFTSRVMTLGLIRLSGAEVNLESVRAGAVGAFCAVGNPRAFFEHVRRDGFELGYTRAFNDHHAYTQADIDAVSREAAGRGARALLTTAKDAVKLRGLDFALPCYVVETGLEFDDESRLLGLLRAAVSERS